MFRSTVYAATVQYGNGAFYHSYLLTNYSRGWDGVSGERMREIERDRETDTETETELCQPRP